MDEDLIESHTHLSGRKAIAADLIKADYFKDAVGRDIALRCPDDAARRPYLVPRGIESCTSFQLIFLSAISSHATLGGAPRLGRVTQPGFRSRTLPRLSLRGTCVWACNRTSTSSGA